MTGLRLLLMLICTLSVHKLAAQNAPLFPTAVVCAPDGSVVMSEKGSCSVTVYSPDGKELKASYSLEASPTGLALSGNQIYVTTFDVEGRLCALDLKDGSERFSVYTGSGACHPVVNEKTGRVYVCNQFQNTISEVDTGSGKVLRTVKVVREPVSAVLSTDGKSLYVANFLPDQRADVDYVSACVSVIDLLSFEKIKDIGLANGSNALHDICASPDGK